jgi:hypothetical protein
MPRCSLRNLYSGPVPLVGPDDLAYSHSLAHQYPLGLDDVLLRGGGVDQALLALLDVHSQGRN